MCRESVNIRGELKCTTAFELPGSVIAGVWQFDQPTSLLVRKLRLDAVLPPVIEESLFRCFADLIPSSSGDLGLDEVEEVFVEKDPSAQGSCS
jgi:hypothetical protein